jgi:hypothetical protein
MKRGNRDPSTVNFGIGLSRLPSVAAYAKGERPPTVDVHAGNLFLLAQRSWGCDLRRDLEDVRPLGARLARCDRGSARISR